MIRQGSSVKTVDPAGQNHSAGTSQTRDETFCNYILHKVIMHLLFLT